MLIPIKTSELTRRLPIITILLMAANMVVFAYQLASGIDTTAVKFGAVPYELIRAVDDPPLFPHSHYLSLLTYMFMHGGFVHIIGNMLFLNTFGPNVEDIMGHTKFLIFYLLCGVVSAVAYILPNFNSTIPLVGASGAIAGVMGAHLRALPGTRIVCLLFFIIRITLPAIVILFPWIILQFYNLGTTGNSNIAWIAHIGGFALGMLLVRKFQSNWFFRDKSEESFEEWE